MWHNLCTILLVFEIFVAFLFIVNVIKNNKKTIKLFFFFIISLMINYLIYIIPVLYLQEVDAVPINLFLEAIKTLIYSIQVFVFNVHFTNYIETFAYNFPIFSVNFTIGISLAIGLTITAAINVLKETIINYYRKWKALNKSSCDIVFGIGDIELNYIKSSSNCVIWLEDESKNIVNDLIEQGYIVINKKLTLDILKSKLFNDLSEYHLVIFNDKQSDKFIKYIELINSYIKEEDKRNFFLHIETNYDKIETIRRELIQSNDIESNVFLFGRNELTVRNLIDEHPLVKYLPNDFILDNTCIKSDKKINVFIIGFGWLNKELYRQLLLNNQFVSIKDDKFVSHLVNYIIIDTNPKVEKDNILNKINYKLNKIEEHPTIKKLEPLANSKCIISDLDSFETIEMIKETLNDENSYNFIFVGCGGDYQNIELSSKLSFELFDYDNYHLFTRVTSSSLIYDHQNTKVTYYGEHNKVLTHDVIINEKLINCAKRINSTYNLVKSKKRSKEWERLDFVEMYNNIYAMLSVRTKLNLLGYDYVDNTSAVNKVSKEEFLNHYFEGNIPNINEKNMYDAPKDYFEITRRNALIYQEHLRWSAFFLLNGYSPMPISKIKVLGENKIYRKDYERKLHASLVHYYSLKDLTDYYKKLCDENNVSFYTSLEDLYYYDCTTLEMSYDVLELEGYKVIKKEK